MEKITKDNYKKVLSVLQPNIETLEEYVNARTPIKFKCNICGYNNKYTIRTIKEKGCPVCNKSVTHRLCDEEYKDRIKEMNIVNIENYVNMSTKIKHKCLIHNYEFYKKPLKIMIGQGCPLCGKERHDKFTESRKTTIDDVKNKLYIKYGNEITLKSEQCNGSSDKLEFYHNMSDGTYHIFVSTPNNILKKDCLGCGVCRGLQVYVGFNDLCTTEPDLVKLLKNIDDGKKYTRCSKKKIDWKCPNCNSEIKSKSVRDVSSRGLSCPYCSDGISYPNKFIYNILTQISNQYDYIEREYTPKWCKFEMNNIIKIGRYDIYIKSGNNEYIIEMDGGLGHGNKNTKLLKKEESKFIDIQKDLLAKEHNIQVIRINCDYKQMNNRYEFIKNNILKSEIINIFNLENVDFDKANLISQESNVVKCCQYWNDGKSRKEICDEMKIWGSTVDAYFKRGLELKLLKNYSPEEVKIRGNCHKVKCINDQLIFNSIVEASKYYNTDASNISRNCRGINDFSFININNEKIKNGVLLWVKN